MKKYSLTVVAEATGYKGTPNTLKMVAENEDLRNNLGAAAHLIHGSSILHTVSVPSPRSSVSTAATAS